MRIYDGVERDLVLHEFCQNRFLAETGQTTRRTSFRWNLSTWPREDSQDLSLYLPVMVLGKDATSSRSSEWQMSKTNEDPVRGKQEQEPVPLLVFSRPPAWVSTCPRAGHQAVVHGHQNGFQHLPRWPQCCMCAVKGGHWNASSCDLKCLPPQHPGCLLPLLLDCFKIKLAAVG